MMSLRIFGIVFAAAAAFLVTASPAAAQTQTDTQRLFLAGKGNKDNYTLRLGGAGPSSTSPTTVWHLGYTPAKPARHRLEVRNANGKMDVAASTPFRRKGDAKANFGVEAGLERDAVDALWIASRAESFLIGYDTVDGGGAVLRTLNTSTGPSSRNFAFIWPEKVFLTEWPVVYLNANTGVVIGPEEARGFAMKNNIWMTAGSDWRVFPEVISHEYMHVYMNALGAPQPTSTDKPAWEAIAEMFGEIMALELNGQSSSSWPTAPIFKDNPKHANDQYMCAGDTGAKQMYLILNAMYRLGQGQGTITRCGVTTSVKKLGSANSSEPLEAQLVLMTQAWALRDMTGTNAAVIFGRGMINAINAAFKGLPSESTWRVQAVRNAFALAGAPL